MKQKFSIPVVRIGYGFKNIEVEANSQEEAEQLALDEAGDHEYSEKSSEYEIEDYPRSKTEDSPRSKTIVRVAWSRKASDIFQEQGWEALEKASENGVEDLVFEEKEFNTPAEAIAYTEGINDANGWDEPMAEIV